jgi:hypothetical protein
MKRSLLWLFTFFIGLGLLASCVLPYAQVSGRHVASVENFSVDLPNGWRQHNASADPVQKLKDMLEKRHTLEWDVLRLTRDGLLLQQIAIGRIPIEKELPNTKRKLAEGMLRMEAAELMIDNFRANGNLTHQEITENAPATLGGQPGFKLCYNYRAEDQLKMEGVFYGVLVGPWLYYGLYEAPAQNYFQKDLPVFDKTVASFQFLNAGS